MVASDVPNYRWLVVCFLTFSLSSMIHPGSSRHIQECERRSADVIFVLDTSGSIYRPDFERQLQWVSDVIEEFDVGRDKMHVGAVSFSNWAFLEFHLNAFYDKQELKRAIWGIAHSKGDTNTAAALTFMKDNMFSVMHGGRRGNPHVAIVITDGESNDPYATSYISEAARRMGIQIFAIGIGPNVNEDELRQIGSCPTDQFVFKVDDYEALQSIKRTVAINACEVPPPEPTLPTSTELPYVDIACGNRVMADVVLAVAPSGSDENTEKALAFFRELAQSMDISPDTVQIGLVPKDCRDIPEINLQTFDKKNEAMQALDRLSNQQQADTGDVIRYMRKTSFKVKHGARERAKKMALIVVDESSENLDTARKQSNRLQREKGVEVFVLGVGKTVKLLDLERLATQPSASHVFHVSSYDDLSHVLPNIQQAICTAPSA